MYLSNENRSLPEKRVPYLIFLAGLAIGVAFFVYYYRQGLSVAHYDAKAHLLVARRMFDSLEPGYGQMGVNWLPLLHLLYLPLVFFDAQYRTGLLPSLISVFSFAASGLLIYRISLRVTGSVPAGVFAAAMLLANPNLQYLQSCPLTEPLYMVLLLLGMDRLLSWRESDHSRQPWPAAIWFSLGGLCRYEGWYVIAGVMLLLMHDYFIEYMPRRKVIQAAAVFAGIFGAPAVAHFGYIYLRLGDSFFGRVAGGHPSPYITYKHPFLSLIYHWGELSQMAALLPLLLAAAGVMLVLYQRKRFSARLPLFLLWLPSLINISALYWGLVYRLRYSVLLLPAVAVFGSLALTSGKIKKLAWIILLIAATGLPWLSWYFAKIDPADRLVAGPGAVIVPLAGLLLYMAARVRPQNTWPLLVLCILGMQVPLLEREFRPMLVETLEHEFIEPERQEVMRHIRRNYDGKRILIDMGKQAPLVYDLGLPVREFIYNEGGETLWHDTIENPVRLVGWMVTENGDAIWERMQVDPNWAAGYALALKTEHFSLYRLKN